MTDSANSSNSNNQGGGGGQSSNRRRRRPRSGNAQQGPGSGQNQGQPRQSQGPGQNQGQPRQGQNQGQSRQGQSQGQGNRSGQSNSRNRRPHGRVLTTNQVLVKYDNLLEQHLITRKKYYEYFNRVDDRQLYRLEKNFYDSIEHLRRFEEGLEPWQREALEMRKTELYRLDLTYSNNRGWDPEEVARAEAAPDENEDPHFKETQKEAFAEYRDDNEESMGSYEDYLKHKGQA